MKTGVCKIHVSPCWVQVAARCLPSFVFQGQWNGFSYKMNWFSSFPVLGQIFLHYSFRNLYTHTHTHLWGLSVKVLIDQAGAFSPTAEAGPTSASTSTKQHHQLS